MGLESCRPSSASSILKEQIEPTPITLSRGNFIALPSPDSSPVSAVTSATRSRSLASTRLLRDVHRRRATYSTLRRPLPP